MIRYPSLWEIISADPFASIACANLAPAGGGIGAVLFFPELVIQPAFQYPHGLVTVFDLALFILTSHDQSGRQMSDTDGAVRRVDALTAVAGRTVHINAQIIGCLLYTSRCV